MAPWPGLEERMNRADVAGMLAAWLLTWPPAGILDPAFHEYVSGFIDSSQAPAAAAAPPVEDEEEAGSKVRLAAGCGSTGQDRLGWRAAAALLQPLLLADVS